jgi:hypothetical protein
MYLPKPPRYYLAEIISYFQKTNVRLTIAEFDLRWPLAEIQRFDIQPGRDSRIGWLEVAPLEPLAVASLSLIPY